MNGAAIPASVDAFPASPPNASVGGGNSQAAVLNSLRISLVAEKLAMYAQSTQSFNDAYFCNLCISLARGLDHAIANNEMPVHVLELPRIFKLVFRRINEVSLEAAIMVLMISVKNACKARWFPSKEAHELLALADEAGRIFSTPEGFSCEQTNVIPIVSQLISRYYPQIKLGHIIASADIKPGFEACAVDFHISKNITYSATERIQLLVAMKDNIDTSSCIINPPKVNILLNGIGVQGRIIGFMYPGPQLPTLVSSMLRYGSNLLQAVGDFDAHYIMLIAFMSVIPSSDLPVPDDFVQPTSNAINLDAEIVEGSSRISLNCPFSFTRIRKPVKGHMCKHLQCFDLSNYIEINSKRPSWRCPHCNQSVCFTDLRVDKKMSKILGEVAEDVLDVIIHLDGSWETTSGGDNHSPQPHAKASEGLLEGLERQQDSGISNIYDLTEGDDDLVILDGLVPEDRKPEAQPDPQRTFSSAADNTRANYISVSPAANLEQQAVLGINHQAPLVQIPRPMPPLSPRLPGNPCFRPPFLPPPTVSIRASASQRDSVQRPNISQSQLQQRATAQRRVRIAPVPAPNNARPTMPVPPMARAIAQMRVGHLLRPPEGSASFISRSTTMGSYERLAAAERAALRTRQPPTTPVQIQTSMVQSASMPTSVDGTRNAMADRRSTPGSGGTTVQTVSRAEDLVDVQSEQNWQPTKRMRGSLVGRACADALNQMVIRPTQTTPASPGQQPNQSNMSPQLQALLANRSSQASQQNAPGNKD